jgi:hypothetical protein
MPTPRHVGRLESSPLSHPEHLRTSHGAPWPALLRVGAMVSCGIWVRQAISVGTCSPSIHRPIYDDHTNYFWNESPWRDLLKRMLQVLHERKEESKKRSLTIAPSPASAEHPYLSQRFGWWRSTSVSDTLTPQGCAEVSCRWPRTIRGKRSTYRNRTQCGSAARLPVMTR